MRWGIVLAAFSGCGGTTTGGTDPGVGSCQQMTMMSGFHVRDCIDYTGLTADQETTLRDLALRTTPARASSSRVPSQNEMRSHRSSRWLPDRIRLVHADDLVLTSTGPGLDVTLYKDTCTAAGGTWITP